MLEELLKDVDEKELKAFTRRFGISKISNKEIADKNAIVTPKTGVAFSRSIAALHTAFNVIAATTKNRNNIEKAKLDRLDTSTKEDYMEARLPLPPEINAIQERNVDLIGGIANALSDFSNLLDDLGDALKRLDLSCNVCIEPCDPDIERPGRRRPVPVTRRTRVGIPQRIPVEERARIAQERTTAARLPAPERVAQAKPAGALQYQPLPEAPDFTRRARQAQPELARAAEGPRTVAQRFMAGEITGEEAAKLQREQVRASRQAPAAAERVAAAKPTGGQARITQPAPPGPTQPRWTSTVPKEQYFEALKANRAQAEFEARVKAQTAGPAPKAPATPLALPAPAQQAQAKGPGFFSRFRPTATQQNVVGRALTTVAESKVTQGGLRALGVVGTGYDIYSRKKAGQSWLQVGAGVGGGLAGAAAGAKAGGATGAAIGALFGGIGAVPGAFVGSVIGGGLGYFGGSWLGDKAYQAGNPRGAKSQTRGGSEIAQVNKRLAPHGARAIVGGSPDRGTYISGYQIGGKIYSPNQLPAQYKNIVQGANQQRPIARRPAPNRGAQKDAEKATRQLVATTKKVQTQAQRVSTQDRRVAANTSSILDKFAGSLNDALRSMVMTSALFPGAMGSIAVGVLGSFGKFNRGFQQGIEGITPASPNEATNQAMSFFMSQGWTKQQAAGIVGNLQVESGNFSPDVVLGRRRGDNGNAFGVAQWNVQYSPERVANFQRIMGRPLLGAGLMEQLQFIQWELNNTEKRAAQALRSTNDPGQAAAIVDAMYERSSGAHRAQRMANAIALAQGGDSLTDQVGRFAGGIYGGVTNFFNDMGNFFQGTPGQFVLPVGSARVSSGYGIRIHPVYGTARLHSGVDFAVPVGTPIRAAESGRVAFAGSSGGYGWNLTVAHGNGLGTRYAHIARFLVGAGQTVQKGQVIALSGGARGMPGAGTSTGAHLHFEVLRNGQAVNPSGFLAGASLAPMDPSRGNNATEEQFIQRTSKVPARGGYLADIVTGNAVNRRKAQGPRVVMVPVATGGARVPPMLAAPSPLRAPNRGGSFDFSRMYFNKQ